MPIVIPTAFIISTLISIAISIAISVALTLLFPKQQPQRQQAQQQPNQPPPPDGSFNEKQPIPPLRVIAGRVRVGGDIAFLEEKGSNLYQIIAHAAHRIEGYVQFWLHDEIATLDPATGNVTEPTHFQSNVRIQTALGLDAETAWALAVSTFPEIWTVDHRGDGIAKAYMRCGGVSSETFSDIYPQGMPLLTALADGAWLYDPRTNQDPGDRSTWSFSRNLALIRLFHLTHPSGGRLRISDLYLPEWAAAADVCDQMVIDRDDAEEPRYWGGLSWKYRGDGQDAVSIGRKIDEAGELVVYQRGDGLIGVHAGQLETPDIWIDDDAILSFRYDANQSLADTVLAVRGHFTDPRNEWNPGDAAIYGDPYSGTDETQRTRTVDNEAVQSHNHIQRLQKLAFVRANAPRVSVAVQYDDAIADIMFRRFVGVRRPSRGLDGAVIELIGGTKLDLSNLTISFDGIVVPADLYDFDAATEEGIPGGIVGDAEATGVPTPTGFTVAWLSDDAGFYGRATWDFVDDTFTYELQYQLADATEPPRAVMSNPTQTLARTPPLPEVDHRFRLRTWSAGTPSPWTAWLSPGTGAGSDGDTTPTADPTSLAASFSGVFGGFGVSWINPGDSNFHHTELYASDTTTFADSELIYTHYGAPGSVGTRNDTGFRSYQFTFGPPPVTQSYWIRSYNVSGVPSNLVGPETATSG